jgi:DNA adenine methylase
MSAPLKSPYPYPGGKASIAPDVWDRLGDCPNFCEPFMGSAAMLLARPHDYAERTETANDLDGFCTNALRAIRDCPEETAYWCDAPVNEIDLTAAHLWLKAQRDDLTARLFADPDYCDPRIAGRWLWGIASWIGDGWCVADGPWVNVDGRLVDRRTLPEAERGEGVWKQLPAIHDHSDVGIRRYRASVPRKMPEIGRSPNGQMDFNRKGIQAYRYRPGVPKKMPSVGSMKNIHGTGGNGNKAIQTMRDTPTALLDYFARLATRLRRVRLLCGDWQRAVKDSVTVNHGLTGVFLDPPYPSAEHSMAYHGDNDIWHDAAAWAISRGDDPRLRICIAGYYTEAIDALFPASWERVKWEARGGYSNQSENGRGRANAKRECLWFSQNCLKPSEEARAAFDRPITVRDADWTGTMFEEVAE